MFSLDRILLPIDFSERCLAGARYAVPTLAKQFAPEINVLHVLAPYVEFGMAEPGMITTMSQPQQGKPKEDGTSICS